MLNKKEIVLFLVAAALVLLLMTAPAGAAKKNCQDCHAEKSLEGTPLYIDPAKYQLTSHSHLGCAACHDKMSKRHPEDGIRSSKVNCQACHPATAAEYAKSGHSNYAGCIDCHNPHSAKSLHAVSVRDINHQCAKCHETTKITKSHAKWLPRTALHIEALPCISCHTASKEYVINLSLYKKDQVAGSAAPINPADFNDLLPLLPSSQKVAGLLDTNDDGLVSLEEMKRFNSDSRHRHIALLGTMMPEVATHNYQVLANRFDCTFCHASGPNVQQVSYIVFPEKDGGYSRLPLEKGAIWDMLYGTPDFYMIGFTRSMTLSIIGAIIVAAGLMVPILHGTLRLLTRKRRKEG